MQDSYCWRVGILEEPAEQVFKTPTIRDMLKRYSEFISFPIELWSEKTEYDTVPDPDAEVKEGEEPPMKSVPKKTNEWERINVAKPLWMRPPKEVTKEEYDEFYKTTFKAYDTPDAYAHFSMEGQVEFRALLFLPSALPWELSQDMFNEQVKAVRLFVKRVFISDSFDDKLLPRWLTFLKGMVDSDDLPLNVSRELLQKSRVLNIISKRLVRKALDMFTEIQQDEEKFAAFTPLLHASALFFSTAAQCRRPCPSRSPTSPAATGPPASFLALCAPTLPPTPSTASTRRCRIL